MHIQWFPGHMTKALRMMEENVKLVDCLIYVLDSRCIAASFNPKLNEIAGGKPILYVLNKADLVEKEHLSAWLKYFKENIYKFRRTGKSAKFFVLYTKKSGANCVLTTIRTGFRITIYQFSSVSSSTSHNISSICWEFIAVLSSYVPGFSLSL